MLLLLNMKVGDVKRKSLKILANFLHLMAIEKELRVRYCNKYPFIFAVTLS